MTADIPAAAAAVLAQNQNDPTFTGLAWVLGVILIIIAISKPIMAFVKEYRSNAVDSAKTTTETLLYEQLQRQLTTLSSEVERFRAERNVWYEKANELESEVRRLQSFEKSVESMRLRLDEKDKLIKERDDEIRKLMHEVIDTKEKVHKLELRLQKDEAQFCKSCVYLQKPHIQD